MAARLFIALVSVLAVSLVAPALAAEPGQTAPAAGHVPCEFPAADRVVVVGSVYGDHEKFIDVLQVAGLIDENQRWIGGDAHLVQLGNLFGAEGALDESIRLMMRLEKEAASAGGMVHALHGKTEHMILGGDLSRLFGADQTAYIPLAGADAEDRRKALIALLYSRYAMLAENEPKRDEALRLYRMYLDHQVKLGGAEFLDTIAPSTEMGDWLRSRNVVVRIGDYVYSFGGISEDFCERSLPDINAEYQARIQNPEWLWRSVDMHDKGPLWWSELSARRDADTRGRVEWIHYHLKAAGQVVGHSPVPRCERRNRVYHVDSGVAGSGGAPLAALEITPGHVAVISRTRRIDLGAPPPAPQAEPKRPPAPAIHEQRGMDVTDPKR